MKPTSSPACESRGIFRTFALGFKIEWNMNYSEVQIKQADVVLKLLHERQGYVDGHELWKAMGHPKAEYMRDQLSEVLYLTTRRMNSYMLTEEGERAFLMGFKAYMKERERERIDPPLVLTREEPRPWYKLNRAEWIGLAGVLIGLLALAVALLK